MFGYNCVVMYFQTMNANTFLTMEAEHVWLEINDNENVADMNV